MIVNEIWKKLTIAHRIVLLSTIPMLVLYLIIFSFLLNARLQDQEAMQKEHGELLVKQLAVASEFAVLTGNREQLQALLQGSATGLVTDIKIWNAQNTLLASISNPLSATAIDRFGSDIAMEPIDVSDALLAPKNNTVQPHGNVIGHIEIALSRENIRASRNRAIVVSALVGMPLLLIGVILVWILGQRLARPVSALTDITVAIANGDLSARAEENAVGEIRVLQSAVNRMAAVLEKNHRHLRDNLEHLELARSNAEQANRAKSEFLATMSHELRTPMNGALGMLELLKNTPLEKQQQQYVDIAIDSTQHLLTVVNDVLDFSRIERGLMQLEPVYTNIGVLLQQTADSFHITAQQKHLLLQTLIDAELHDVRVLVDAARLRQIVVNLLGNALKFTFSGSVQIVARSHWQNEQILAVELAVTDTGIGIPVDKQQLIFQPFRQADGSTVRRFGGSGLGLAIVQKLCELMSATIQLESTPGLGSSFRIQFTAAARRPLIAEPQQTPPLALPSAKVLVVEDNAINQMVIANMLESLGLTTQTANNGVEALKILDEHMFDLILMDCQMPEMDGYQTTYHIRCHHRQQLANTPIIALTANAMLEDRERCLAAGMSDYLSKPVTLQMLRDKLEHWLRAVA